MSNEIDLSQAEARGKAEQERIARDLADSADAHADRNRRRHDQTAPLRESARPRSAGLFGGRR